MGDAARWTLGEFTVECPREVMAAIEGDVLAGFHGLLEGGVEVGGVLFGTSTGRGLRVLAWRPVACDYSSGPRFRLSASDEAGLQRVLESAAQDPELAGMEAVGWYRSQTHGVLMFSSDDLDLHCRYFGDGQIALLLQPDRAAATRTALFVGQEGGVVPCGGTAPVPPEEAAPPAGKRLWPWIAAAAIPLLLLSLPWLRNTGSGIGLRVVDSDGQLDIRWDREAPAVKGAGSAYLEIADGQHRLRIDLKPAQLQHGSVSYERNAPEATVRMVVTSPDYGTAEESVQVRAPQ